MGVPSLSDSAGYAEGKPAVGPTVRSDLEAIQAEMDRNIDRDNLKDGEVITVKLAAAAVDSTKLGTNSVYEDHVFFGSSGGGLLCPRVGPNYNDEGGVSSAPRIAMVSKEVTWDGTSEDTVVFTYAADCVDGNPAFTAIPHLMGAPIVVTASGTINQITTWECTQTSAASITFDFEYGGGTGTVIIEFGVMGAMSS